MPEADRAALAQSPVFGGLSPEELGQVAARLEERRFAPGDIVVREGEPAREMFVIRSGRVDVVKQLPAGAGEGRLASLGAGDCFGEMSLIDIQPRSATVRAAEPTVAWTLAGADLRSLCAWRTSTYALIVGNIAREISRRLRSRDAVAVEFLCDRRRADAGKA